MSAFAIFYVGAGALAIGFLVLARRLLAPRAPEIAPTPEQWGLAPDDLRWEDEALEEHHHGLTTVRSSAAKWGESIGALLGVFALVAFVKGPDTFTDITGVEAEAAALLVVLAAAFAGAAVMLAALAAQGTATDVSLLDGWALRTLTAARTKAAAKQLAWSRVLAVGAAMLVLVAVGLTWLAALRERDESGATSQHAVVISQASGEVVCGELTMARGTLSVTPANGPSQHIAALESVSIVKGCP